MSIRKSSWHFKTSSSTSVSAAFVGAQKSSFVLISKDGSEVTFEYAAAGAGVGKSLNKFGIGGSTIDDWSAGDIFITNGFSGHELEVSDIEGACQIFDAGGAAIVGFSGTVMALGIPTKHIPRHLWRTSLIGMAVGMTKAAINGDDDLPTDATALLIMAGETAGTVGVGVMGSYGYVWAGDVKQNTITFEPPASHDLFLTTHATSKDLIYLPTDVLFGFDKSDLKPSSFDVLVTLAKQIKFMKPSRIAVEGHTDSIGTASYNYGLSYKRAWSVAQFLIADEVLSAAQISVIGLAHTRPIEPDQIGHADNPKGRAKNRRVEVRLYW
jgi:outer membrane protein OmpA-like peptidoglycan-associated protein